MEVGLEKVTKEWVGGGGSGVSRMLKAGKMDWSEYFVTKGHVGSPGVKWECNNGMGGGGSGMLKEWKTDWSEYFVIKTNCKWMERITSNG